MFPTTTTNRTPTDTNFLPDFYGAPPPQDADDIDFLDPTLLYLLQTRFNNQQSSGIAGGGGAPVLSLDSLLSDISGSPSSIPVERNPFGAAGKDNEIPVIPADLNAPVGSPMSSTASNKAVEQTGASNKETQESKRVVPERVLRNTLMLLARNGCRLPLKKFEEIYAKEFGSTFDSKAYGFGCLRLALLSLPGVTLTTDTVWLWSCRTCGVMASPETGRCKCTSAPPTNSNNSRNNSTSSNNNNKHQKSYNGDDGCSSVASHEASRRSSTRSGGGRR